MFEVNISSSELLNVLVSLVFYNWYFISYVVTFWLQGLSILILNAVGFKKKQDSMCFSFQLHRHVVFLLAVNNSSFHIHETHVCLRFCVCTYMHPVPHGALSFE